MPAQLSRVDRVDAKCFKHTDKDKFNDEYVEYGKEIKEKDITKEDDPLDNLINEDIESCHQNLENKSTESREATSSPETIEANEKVKENIEREKFADNNNDMESIESMLNESGEKDESVKRYSERVKEDGNIKSVKN